MKNIFKHGITSNMLKLIALVTMLIDHIGFYFEPYMSVNTMITLRLIGRMAMPIYTYLIVQGFFHTSDLKKYITRICFFAIITQLVITGMYIIDYKFVEAYTSDVVYTLNVLCSYAMSLGIIKLIHEDVIIKKWDYTKNLSLKVVVISIFAILLILLPFDYNIEIPILVVLFYILEKIKIKFMINTEHFRNVLGKVIKINENTIIHAIYVLILFIILWSVTYIMGNNMTTLLAIIPIAMYNGERGNKSKILKNIYYIFFPIHHVLLYSIAMILTLT